MMTKKETRMASAIARIAKEHLDLETLAERGRDSLDFHDLSVGSIREALEAAYEAGMASKETK